MRPTTFVIGCSAIFALIVVAATYLVASPG
jgi:hypothetical protein